MAIVNTLDKTNPREVQAACIAMERTIHKLANRYARNQLQEREELFAIGQLGLARAIEKWDPTKGAAFSTHATWWILEGIRGHARAMYARINSTSSVEIDVALNDTDEGYDMDIDTAIDLERKLSKMDEVTRAIVDARHEGHSFDAIAKGLTKLGHKRNLHQVRNQYIAAFN